MFENRRDAGKQLAKLLEKYKNDKNVIVLGILRGGIVVAKEVANYLNSKLYPLVTKKLSSPFDPELAIGAISQCGSIVINEDIIKELGISKEYIIKEKERILEEIRERLEKFNGPKSLEFVKNKIVIIVDDGIATGATLKAAVYDVKKFEPKKVVIAVPVAQKDVLKEFEKIVDETYCVLKVDILGAIGMFYVDFKQVNDEEVKKILSSF